LIKTLIKRIILEVKNYGKAKSFVKPIVSDGKQSQQLRPNYREVNANLHYHAYYFNISDWEESHKKVATTG
jgi:hypothetical protein